LGATSQFDCIGCQEAQQIVKRALILRRQHGLESLIISVDFVKAFDTMQLTLLLQVLEKYGIPQSKIDNTKNVQRHPSQNHMWQGINHN
jgi:hypothetical protein